MTRQALFGTSGIRGDAEILFTDRFCFDVGRAFCLFLAKHRQSGPIAVGMDPRGSSPRIERAVMAGLAFEKRSVLDQGGCPIPAVHYTLLILPVAGSLMVTGSHVAPHLNGVKFFAFREEILKEHEREIEAIYGSLKGKTPFRLGEVEIQEDDTGRREYEEMLVRLAGRLPDWKIVVDPGNGAQSGLISRVLTRLGARVIPLNDHLQGEFMSRDTETQDSFRDLQKTVLARKAYLGIGFDADGDRVVFVDEKGRFLPGDYTGTLLARAADTETVVTPINTSQVIEKIGKKVLRTKVGSPRVVEAMKKSGARFGFEGNGGGIHADVMMSRDGGTSAVKLLKILEKSGKSLSGLVSELPSFFVAKDKIDCPSDFNPKILSCVKKMYNEKRTEDLDGLKIWLDETTWILFRPSSNAPEFRVFAEAKSQKRADRLVKDGLALVASICDR